MKAQGPRALLAAVRSVAVRVGLVPRQPDGTAQSGRDPGVHNARGSSTANGLELPFLSMAEFKKVDLPERRTLVPWLWEGSLAMIYGPRGVGKTYFVLSLAIALVRGGHFLKWQVKEPVGVLVIDGEMPAAELRERLDTLLLGEPPAQLEILSHEIVFQRLERDLTLGLQQWQDAIMAHLKKRPELRVIIVDNLSCLLPNVQEDKRDEWVQKVLPFLIALRRRGVAVILIHHAGKGGDQRGTSAREDALDTVIRLSKLPDHDATQEAAFRVTFTKARGCYGDDLADFEARLEADSNGAPKWVWKPVEESNKERLIAIIRDGITSVTDAAEELGLTKGAVSKLKKQLQDEGRLEPSRKLLLAH